MLYHKTFCFTFKCELNLVCENYLPIGHNKYYNNEDEDLYSAGICQLNNTHGALFISLIDPIRMGVRKNSVICKFEIHHFQNLILIGLTNEHFVI